MSVCLANAERFRNLNFVKFDNDFAFDIESWCGFVAIRPSPHALRRSAVACDVNFYKLNPIFLEISSCPTTARAPWGAIHDQVALRLHGCYRSVCTGWIFAFRWAQAGHFRQDPEQYIIIRLVIDRMNIDITDDTRLVNHKDCALGIAILRTKNAIQLGDMPMWIKIAQKWVSDVAQTFCPGS
jgi:hypothetical protein